MKALIVIAVTAVLSSCATERPARAAALDPANPAAPESLPLAAVTLERAPVATEEKAESPAAGHDAHKAAESPPSTKPGHDHGSAKGEGTKGEASYTCPMHPEVVSPKPGKCPKCGMKLVPKTAAPAPEKTK